MSAKRLFAFGSNGSGQLALGHHDDVSEPSACILPNDLDSSFPVRVTAGGNHTLVLYSSGSILATGDNTDGRCGLRDAASVFSSFQRTHVAEANATAEEGFSLCTATWEASTFVTRSQRVYNCGSGPKGELGLGPSVMQAPQLQHIADFPPAGTTIVDLTSCMGHVIAVLSDGCVYGWGNGRKGQLGEPATTVWSPRKVQGLDFRVVRAVCGREFTYLVGDPETGDHSVLGPDKWNVVSMMPPDVTGWVDIGASWGSIFVLRSDQSLKSWGRNDHGQLAPADLPAIKAIAVGSEHVLALTATGTVLAWGWGEHGNCGPHVNDLGDSKGPWTEISLGAMAIDVPVRGVGAGCATSWLWTD